MALQQDLLLQLLEQHQLVPNTEQRTYITTKYCSTLYIEINEVYACTFKTVDLQNYNAHKHIHVHDEGLLVYCMITCGEPKAFNADTSSATSVEASFESDTMFGVRIPLIRPDDRPERYRKKKT